MIEHLPQASGLHATLRGSNQTGVRARNERLVLTLVRQGGPLSKAQIARLTGLSAQTVSVIVRALESEGLLEKGEPVRGKVGQPSVPIALAAHGAYFLGLKIGRRSAELVLTNFVGEIVGRAARTYAYPTPEATLEFARASIARLTGALSPDARARLAGLGIAMPFEIWEWARVIGLPAGTMDAWRDTDIRARLAEVCDCPVYLQNDATSACGAELVFGDGRRPQNFLYFYVGYFIGGGVVLDGRLFTGPTGNAGAIGPIPVVGRDGRVTQLLEVASLSVLEADLRADGIDGDALWRDAGAWDVPAAALERWTARTADALAQAIIAAISVIDFEAVLIDGWMPAPVRAGLVDAMRSRLAVANLTGLRRPELREGSIGPDARALGAASLPLSDRFLVDSEMVAPAN